MTYTHDLTAFDFATIHAWLTTSYWSPGISRERVERAFRNSTVVVGAFNPDGRQVGAARCVTDSTRFAYLADVFVDETQRGRGIAKEMVMLLLKHPSVADADTCYLVTKDAHAVYRSLGFDVYPNPERFMVRRKAKPPA